MIFGWLLIDEYWIYPFSWNRWTKFQKWQIYRWVFQIKFNANRWILLIFWINFIGGQALEQLMMFGGTDVSELFQKRSENKLEMFNLKSPTDFGKAYDLFWWNDPTCIVGGITAQERHICVQNKARGTQCHLTVCEEDSIYVIQAKFFAAYPESKIGNIVWRKKISTVSPCTCLLWCKWIAV